MAFKLKTGRPKGTLKYASPASTLIALGQPLKVASNALAVVSSGNTIWGIANNAKASSDAATTAVEITPISKSTIFVADVGTGTMADSYVGSTCDLKSGATSTIDLTADTNHDVLVIGWDSVNTAQAYVRFTNPAF
jgi:hypothetical protein